MQKYQPVVVEGLPRFHGGAVGFLNKSHLRQHRRKYTTNTENSQQDRMALIQP
jgi:hypothetical protein